MKNRTDYHILTAKLKSTLNEVFESNISPLTHRWEDINKYQSLLDTYLDDVAIEAKQAAENLVKESHAEDTKKDPVILEIIELIKVNGGVDVILSRRKGTFKVMPGDLMSASDLIHYSSILNSIAMSVSIKGDIDPVGILLRKSRELEEKI